jgi:hypothetical protein
LKCLPLTELSSTMLRPANPVREVIDQIPWGWLRFRKLFCVGRDLDDIYN